MKKERFYSLKFCIYFILKNEKALKIDEIFFLNVKAKILNNRGRSKISLQKRKEKKERTE